MWFLEIYYKNGKESMRCFNSYKELRYALGMHTNLFALGRGIRKCITYYSDGQSVTHEIIYYFP